MKKIVVGRRKEDLEEFGTKGTGYIGKHIVGEEEEAHLTNPVVLDLLRPHVILICGKRGSGKSYSAAVIAEEIALLPEEFRKNLTVVLIDTMGIYWSSKLPNEQQVVLLDEWGLKPKGLEERVKVYVPFEQKPGFEEASIPVDFGISIPPYAFSGEDWSLAFNLPMTNPLSIGLQKNVNNLRERNEKFDMDDLISKIKDDRGLDTHTRSGLENMLTVANQWGVFGDVGVRIEEIMKPGKINIFDVSRLRATEAWSVRNLLVAMIARKIYDQRILARKQEELAKMGEIELKEKKPMVWLMIDECLPGDSKIVTNKGLLPIKSIVKRHKESESFKVLGYDNESRKYGYYDIIDSFEKPRRELLKIKTETGEILECTPDHKILSRKGFIEAKDAEEVATSILQPYKNDKKYIKSRILAHIFGDGWLQLNFTSVGFSGKEKDLERIKKDLKVIGFSSSEIESRMTHSHITTKKGKGLKVAGTSTQFHASTRLYRLLSRLGAPKGDKVTREFLLPKWLMNSSDNEKAEFLGALMGSDGYTPTPRKSVPTSFNAVRLSFNKSIELEENALKYAKQIKTLFEDLGIKVSNVSKRKGNIRKNGSETEKIVITLSNSTENLVHFLKRVGYRYCEEKEIEACKVLAYLKVKFAKIKNRKKLLQKARRLHKRGFGRRKVAKKLSIPDSDAQNWLYFSKGNVRIPNSFPEYKKWVEDRFRDGILFEKIVKKKKIGPRFVYDISVSKIHNFVTNKFIVHNCHQFVSGDIKTVSTNPLLTIVKQGREPGISFVPMTQMPNKVHQDVISQCDIVISHRLTSRNDLEALHAVMQTYLKEDIWGYIDSLPKWIGSAIVLDDNSERIYTLQVRPRLSWHAGEAAIAVTK